MSAIEMSSLPQQKDFLSEYVSSPQFRSIYMHSIILDEQNRHYTEEMKNEGEVSDPNAWAKQQQQLASLEEIRRQAMSRQAVPISLLDYTRKNSAACYPKMILEYRLPKRTEESQPSSSMNEPTPQPSTSVNLTSGAAVKSEAPVARKARKLGPSPLGTSK